MNHIRILPLNFLLTVSVLAGCASQSLPLVPVSMPSLNTQSSAYLGERLLMQGRGINTDVLRVDRLRGKFVSVNNQTFCRTEPGSDKFVSFNSQAAIFFNFVGGFRGYTNKVSFKRGEVCFSDIWSGCFNSSEAVFSLQTDGLCASPNSVQRIIEYNGKTGDTLNFTYREVYGSRVSAPVTQNFTMDLRDGNEITYKGARLRIYQASNQEITYAVLRNFGSNI